MSCNDHLQLIVFLHPCYQTSCMSCKKYNSLYIQFHFSAIQLQFYCNNFFSTIMHFPYDYNHNVMMASFSSSHQNSTHSTRRISWWFFFEILIFILDGLKLWHMTQLKVSMWHINWILETKKTIYIYIYIYIPSQFST